MKTKQYMLSSGMDSEDAIVYKNFNKNSKNVH